MRTVVVLDFGKRLPCMIGKWRMAICIDAQENIYYTDSSQFVIKRMDYKGEIHDFAGARLNDSIKGPPHPPEFSTCQSLAVSDDGTVYLATAQGLYSIRNGRVTSAFNRGAGRSIAPITIPLDVCVDTDGLSVIVAGANGQSLRRITPDGQATDVLQSHQKQYYNPFGVCSDGKNIFFTDMTLNSVRKVAGDQIERVNAVSAREIAVYDGLVYIARNSKGKPRDRKQPLDTITTLPIDSVDETQEKPLDTGWVFSGITMMRIKNGFLYTLDAARHHVTRTNLETKWEPKNHHRMSSIFKQIIRTCLLMRARPGTGWDRLPREIVFSVFECLYATY